MQTVVEVVNSRTIFGEKVVHDGLNLSVPKGTIYGILGPSGCGKTTLLRQMLMLQSFQGGRISVLGYDIASISSDNANLLRKQWGVLFQMGALFSSLSVWENIALPLVEYTNLSKKIIDEIVDFKISIVGLRQSDGVLYPSQISGGMKKKVALARALAMDPSLLFLDEPTSGLDPVSAREFDALILKLKDMLDVSIVMVSHDLQSIRDTLDLMAIIDEKKIVYEGDLEGIKDLNNDFVRTFFGIEQKVCV